MCTCVFVFLCTDWCFECVECVSVSVCVCVLIYFQWEINPKKDISPLSLLQILCYHTVPTPLSLFKTRVCVRVCFILSILP